MMAEGGALGSPVPLFRFEHPGAKKVSRAAGNRREYWLDSGGQRDEPWYQAEKGTYLMIHGIIVD
jgi:hypothetical protein